MKRHALVVALSVAIGIAWMSLAAKAQQAEKVPRLGWEQGDVSTRPYYEGLRQGLRELGYVEGKNISIVVRSANGELDRLPELVRELVRLNVDVLLVAGDQGLRAAKEATTTIPIVVIACDPSWTTSSPVLRVLAAKRPG
jgi:putative tryptophan/tyrosine transport system substrate-binding protein